MTEYVDELYTAFAGAKNPIVAAGQEAYLKDKFKLFGLKTPVRKELQKPFLLKENIPSKMELTPIIKELWQLQEREFQYFAIDLFRKFIKKIELDDFAIFELMITEKSWWDTVDLIATNLVGAYFKIFPDQIFPMMDKWMDSGNIWLQRTCLIFQLKYKENINPDLLTSIILPLLGSKEFFINKAIGWILREYTRTNPDWVLNFVDTYENQLSNLSKREALRLIK